MSNVGAYLELLKEQLKLRRGPDSDEADTEDHRLADEMDTVWRRMSQAERDESNAQAEILLRREEERYEINKVLDLLREVVEKVDPDGKKRDPKLAKRLAAIMAPSMGVKPVEMEHVELLTDLSLIAQNFQLLDARILETGILPDAWQPKASKDT